MPRKKTTVSDLVSRLRPRISLGRLRTLTVQQAYWFQDSHLLAGCFMQGSGPLLRYCGVSTRAVVNEAPNAAL